jgi:hypothetical protein
VPEANANKEQTDSDVTDVGFLMRKGTYKYYRISSTFRPVHDGMDGKNMAFPELSDPENVTDMLVFDTYLARTRVV